MTDTPPSTSEITAYQLAVERHLSDLPARIRDDLLPDLEAHLSEVAAELEPGVTLADRLGSPEAYARELRETAEVDREGAGKRLKRSLTSMVGPVARRARGAADRFTSSAGAGESREFWESLKSGWWVLRGVLAAMLFTWWFAREVQVLNLPYETLSGLILFGAVTLGFIWLSVWLGVKSQRWGRNYRRMVAAGGLVLILLALSNLQVWQNTAFHLLDDSFESAAFSDDSGPVDHVLDVYVYTENGQLLHDVYLFDQDGNPLRIGDPWACPVRDNDPFEDGFYSDDVEPDVVDDERYGYLYPLCMPGEEPTESPTPEPSETASPAEPTETPTDAEQTETPTPEPTQN